MKYVVFLGDGMADIPVEALGGKTPLAVAKKENIDRLAPKSEIGLARTVPLGMKPGSDTANLAVLGYDPRTCYTGRSPLEALSMGIELADTDVAVRCNLVTLSDESNYADKTMVDYSSGEISTEEARVLIAYIEEKLGTDRLSFHSGISYRHCLIVHDAELGTELTPPHDITGKKIKRHLPSGKLGDIFLDLQKASYELLKDHPINVKRVAEGKNPANSVWFWGEGTKPALPDFYEKNGIHGAIISAVDLLKGIGKGANMQVIDVPGATGNVHTDFAAKGRAAIEALKTLDYVYIHVEAPDESGHQGSLEDKITSIEKIDSDIVGPVLDHLESTGEPYHVLVCPDHPTPLATRTHSGEPIPYLIYKSDAEIHSGVAIYDEESAASTGIFLDEGFRLMEKLLSTESEGNIVGLTPDVITFGDGTEESLAEESLAEGSEETEAPTEEGTDATEDTDGAEVSGAEEGADPSDQPAPTEGDTEAPKETPKEKKPNKFAVFFKKHLLFFIILISVLVVAGGLAAGHFITTYHYAFIRTESGLEGAIAKDHITRFIFKKDVTVTKDITIDRPVDFDLNGYTLTVEGDLTLSVTDDVMIGYKKCGSYKVGGAIVTENFSAIGTATLSLLADVTAENVFIECEKTDIQGTIGDENVTLTLKVNEAAVSGAVAGTIDLSEATTLALSNDAATVKGGSVVRFTSGKAGTIEGTQTLYVYEDAEVDMIVNVTNYYRVTTLAKPTQVLVVNEDNEFYCYVPEVIGATHIAYSVNGVEKAAQAVTPGATTRFKIEGITPGNQVLKVRATAPNDPAYLDSEEYEVTFDFAVKIEAPVVDTPVLSDDKVTLVIHPVRYAEKVTYTVDGESDTASYESEDKALSIDITEKVQAGGVHTIKVVAQSDNEYFTDSNEVLTSYVKYETLKAPVATAAKDGDSVVFSWDAVEGRTDYYLVYGDQRIFIKSTTVSFPYAEGTYFSVKAIGGGYYTDSAVTIITSDDIAALFPTEEQGDEQENGDENSEEDEPANENEQTEPAIEPSNEEESGDSNEPTNDAPEENEEESTGEEA